MLGVFGIAYVALPADWCPTAINLFLAQHFGLVSRLLDEIGGPCAASHGSVVLLTSAISILAAHGLMFLLTAIGVVRPESVLGRPLGRASAPMRIPLRSIVLIFAVGLAVLSGHALDDFTPPRGLKDFHPNEGLAPFLMYHVFLVGWVFFPAAFLAMWTQRQRHESSTDLPPR